VRDLRSKSAQILKQLPGAKEMILTSNGKPIAIFSAISAERLEEALEAFRRARATLAVDSMQKRSAESGLDRMSLSEINDEIAAARKRRRPQ